MACIIKLPHAGSKGVVSFTTPEQKYILGSRVTFEKLSVLKSKFVIGLHHNWHDFNFDPNPIFDFHFAGSEDLIAKDKVPFRLIDMDACNFSKPEFRPSGCEKFWDVLFVGNAVFFKDPMQLLISVREIFDRGHLLRVLYICPMPAYRFSERNNVVYDLRRRYEDLFSSSERQLFNLLILRDDYPRFFDRETLAHFYKSSRVFVHTAPDERRCRVAAYAWASGMRVVGKSCVGSILPTELRKEPFFYEVTNNHEYADKILKALADYKDQPTIDEGARKVCSSFYTNTVLREKLEGLFVSQNLPYRGELIFKNLDFRLGWHHGFGITSNSVNQTLDDFIDSVINLNSVDETKMVDHDYAELLLLDPQIKRAQFNSLDTNVLIRDFLHKWCFEPLKKIFVRLPRKLLRGFKHL